MRKLFFALVSLAVVSCTRGHGRYLITKEYSRTIEQYRTDSYKKVGPCVLFTVDGDSVGICGSYKITEEHD